MTYTDEMYHTAMNILDARYEQLDDDELEHHGILGMKWGVRRYQNDDGSLTPEGERRYVKLSKGEKLAKMNTKQGVNTGAWIGAAAGGVFPGSLIGGATGSLATNKTASKLKYMSDDEAKNEEKYVKEGMRSGYKAERAAKGALLGGIGGTLVGSTLGAVGGLALSKVTNDPAMLIGAANIGANLGLIGGMTIGGVSGYKGADSRFDKRYDKWDADPNMEYRKRTKDELREYDSSH